MQVETSNHSSDPVKLRLVLGRPSEGDDVTLLLNLPVSSGGSKCAKRMTQTLPSGQSGEVPKAASVERTRQIYGGSMRVVLYQICNSSAHRTHYAT